MKYLCYSASVIAIAAAMMLLGSQSALALVGATSDILPNTPPSLPETLPPYPGLPAQTAPGEWSSTCEPLITEEEEEEPPTSQTEGEEEEYEVIEGVECSASWAPGSNGSTDNGTCIINCMGYSSIIGWFEEGSGESVEPTEAGGEENPYPITITTSQPDCQSQFQEICNPTNWEAGEPIGGR